MKTKLTDGLIFMTIARGTIKDVVEIELKKRENPYNLKKLNEFVFNTLNDSQILHILLTNELDMSLAENSKESLNLFLSTLLENEKEISLFLNPSHLIENLINLNEYGVSSKKDSIKRIIEEGIFDFTPADAEEARQSRIKILKQVDKFSKYALQSEKTPQEKKKEMEEIMRRDIERAKSPAPISILMSKNLFSLTGITLATLFIYGAYKVYQGYFSKAAKSCKGKSGGEKMLCMEKFKKDALDKQKIELRKGLNVCNKSKNPQECKKVLNNKIKKIEGKISKIGK